MKNVFDRKKRKQKKMSEKDEKAELLSWPRQQGLHFKVPALRRDAHVIGEMRLVFNRKQNGAKRSRSKSFDF